MNNGKTSESGSGTLNDEQCAVSQNRLIGYIFQSFDPGIRYTFEKSIEIPLLIADAMKAERIIR